MRWFRQASASVLPGQITLSPKRLIMKTTTHRRIAYVSTLPDIKEIEEKTAILWLQLGTIKITDIGQENTYYIDQFENQFYCKNYPR